MDITLIVLATAVPLAIAFAITFFVIRDRQAFSRRFASTQAASTITLIGVRDRDLDSSLSQALDFGGPASRTPVDFLVTFALDGMTMWTFSKSPRRILTIPAARVFDVTVGTRTERPEYRLPVRPRLAVVLAPLDDSLARETTLQFAVSEVDLLRRRLVFADEVELQTLAGRARDALEVARA